MPFPQMAENVDAAFNQYTQDVQQVTALCGVSDLEELQPGKEGMGAQGLKVAMTQLPALTERKRTIDMHMNIATALLRVIKERSLDAFVVAEEAIQKQVFACVHARWINEHYFDHFYCCRIRRLFLKLFRLWIRGYRKISYDWPSSITCRWKENHQRRMFERWNPH